MVSGWCELEMDPRTPENGMAPPAKSAEVADRGIVRAPADLAAVGRRGPAPTDLNEAFEFMLLSAHRIAVSLGELGVFQNTKLSVAEWAILKALGNRQNVPIKEIVAASGISRQRLRKLISELEAKGAVLTNRSDAEDKRARTISATPVAAQVVALVSKQLESLIADTGGPAPGRALIGAARSMRLVANTIRSMLAGKRRLQVERRSAEAEAAAKLAAR
jgi:DNA-binding MarR family transcriptional regulator